MSRYFGVSKGPTLRLGDWTLEMNFSVCKDESFYDCKQRALSFLDDWKQTRNREALLYPFFANILKGDNSGGVLEWKATEGFSIWTKTVSGDRKKEKRQGTWFLVAGEFERNGNVGFCFEDVKRYHQTRDSDERVVVVVTFTDKDFVVLRRFEYQQRFIKEFERFIKNKKK